MFVFKFFVFIVDYCFYYFLILVFIAVIIIIFNDYFTSFYVKYFELPLCMKCAI